MISLFKLFFNKKRTFLYTYFTLPSASTERFVEHPYVALVTDINGGWLTAVVKWLRFWALELKTLVRYYPKTVLVFVRRVLYCSK